MKHICKTFLIGISLFILIGCGGGGSSSSTTTTTSSSGTSNITQDIKVISVEALNTSNAVVSSSVKLEGKDELKLKLVLKNTGSSRIVSSTSTYKYLLSVTKYDDSNSVLSKSVDIVNLTSLDINDTMEITINTGHYLKNTDKSYEFTFNDQTINNVFSESNYTNNVKSIDNVIFEDIEFEIVVANTGVKDGAGVFSDNISYSSSQTYAHQIAIKNTSAFNFYGDLTFSFVNTPFLYNNNGTYSIKNSNLEISAGATGGTIENFFTRNSISASSYVATFKVNYIDSVISDNSTDITLSITN